eukprot:SAG31_NODE_5026_length_2798_cov_1.188959_2_plen_358_part_00
MKQEEIAYQAKEIITGQLRAVVAQMDIDQINTDRKKFNEMIDESVTAELKKIGLELVNVNITDVNDASGKIEAQGKKAAAESIEKARIDEATERKKGEVGTAEQEMQKRIAVAQSLMQQKIGVAEAEKSQRIREAEINYDTVSAENKNRELVAVTERDLKITLAETYGASESKDREQKAMVEEAEAKAYASAAMEKANRIEAEKRAEFEAPAKAMKATTILEAQAEAEKTIIEARGKADATFIQMEAEAKGHFELLDKKAQGLGALVSSCGSADEAFKLLMLEHVDTLAETSAKAISNIKFDKVTVWDGGAGANGNSATSDFIRSLTQSLPPSMEVIEKVAGVKLPAMDLDTKKIDA